MNSQFDYSFEKFGLAADDLTIYWFYPIKERLSRAFDHIGRVRERDVPEELRAQFHNIFERITIGIPQNREGTLQATLNQITEEEMNKLSDDIVAFNRDLVWWRRDNARN